MVAIKRGLEACVEALLIAGADPNLFLKTSKYRSPLLLATFVGLERCVQLLLHFGADPNFKTLQHHWQHSRCPGHQAAVITWCHPQKSLVVTRQLL